MKSALIVATVGSFIAGFEFNDAMILKNMGFEVHVASNMDGLRSESKKKLDDTGIITHQIDFARSPYSKKNLRAYVELKELMAKLHPDLVHCHTPMGGVLARLTSRKYRKIVRDPDSGKKSNIGTKVIYTAHGFHFFKGAPLKNWLIYFPVELICSYMTDMIITIAWEDYRLAKRHMHAGEVKYIPGVGLDRARFYPGDEEKDRREIREELKIPLDAHFILSVGELNVNKNHAAVIRAISKLVKISKNKHSAKPSTRGDIYYAIAGTGELRRDLIKLLNELGLQKRVFLLGYRPDVPKLLHAADIYVLPSLREGLNVSLMEAMAAGKPAACGRIRGNNDLIDEGRGGYLFNPNREEEIGGALDILLGAAPHMLKEMGRYNFKKIASFDRKIVEKRMKRNYASLG